MSLCSEREGSSLYYHQPGSIASPLAESGGGAGDSSLAGPGSSSGTGSKPDKLAQPWPVVGCLQWAHDETNVRSLLLHTTITSNPDTNGTEESVLISEVSLFQGLNCMQELFLGKEKMSLLERCPRFRSVLRERTVSLFFTNKVDQLFVFSFMILLLSSLLHSPLVTSLSSFPTSLSRSVG